MFYPLLSRMWRSRVGPSVPHPDPAPLPLSSPADDETIVVRRITMPIHDHEAGDHTVWHGDVPLSIRLKPPRVDPTMPRADSLILGSLGPQNLSDTANSVLAREDDPVAESACAETHISRASGNTPSSHADAENDAVDVTPTRNTDTGGGVTPPDAVAGYDAAVLPGQNEHVLVAGGPDIVRDRAALLEIVRYRILGFRDLNVQVFGARKHAVISRRMQALRKAGYINTWEERLVVGGRPRYALPTAKGLAWALAELAAEAEGQPHEKLVAYMLGDRAKKPLVLAPNTAPNFLPHQLETNRVVAALERVPSLGILWASTWHRPFPNEYDGEEMPQPDAVLVAMQDGQPHLVFLELDRNAESPSTFARRKTERYALFAQLGFAQELFGIEDFTVWVVVTDPVQHKPMERLTTLLTASRGAAMMRFTLAGWAYGHAKNDPAIWFGPYTRPENMGLNPAHHARLLGPFAPHIDEKDLSHETQLLRRMRQYRRPEQDLDEDDPFSDPDDIATAW